MLWSNNLFHVMGDLTVVAITLTFGYYIYHKLPDRISPWASRAIILGLFLMAVFFAADLFLIFLPSAEAQEWREFLQTSLRPLAAFIAITSILGGLLLIISALTSSAQDAEDASERLQETLQALPDGLLTLDENLQIVAANPTAEEMLGDGDRSIIGSHIATLFYELDPGQGLRSGRLPARSLAARHFPAEISCTTISGNRQLVLVRNITETAGLEAQLRQSQKMESLGRLAGGIAHDFNNYLTVVLGEVELLDPAYPISEESANRIREAAERAAELTNQLLSFSRKQVLDTTVFDPIQAIEDMQGLLKNVLGKEVDLRCEHDEETARVQVDRAQFEQVIVNLAINARDAMPTGGELVIHIGNVYLDETFAKRHPDIEAGNYVLVAVTDTGSGMSPEIQEHIFEPFYTTKPRGRGTGLGLAMVMGFIKQSIGTIEVESAEGRGTTMRMFLPATQAAARADSRTEEFQTGDLQGGGTILVAEDDHAVRAFVVRALRQNGYDIIDFDNANDAYAALTADVDLLLTDIVMPNGSGYDLARRAAGQFPDLPVLYMTGYIDYATVGADEPAPLGDTLRKPFSVRELLSAVKENIRATNPDQAGANSS